MDHVKLLSCVCRSPRVSTISCGKTTSQRAPSAFLSSSSGFFNFANRHDLVNDFLTQLACCVLHRGLKPYFPNRWLGMSATALWTHDRAGFAGVCHVSARPPPLGGTALPPPGTARRGHTEAMLNQLIASLFCFCFPFSHPLSPANENRHSV